MCYEINPCRLNLKSQDDAGGIILSGCPHSLSDQNVTANGFEPFSSEHRKFNIDMRTDQNNAVKSLKNQILI